MSVSLSISHLFLFVLLEVLIGCSVSKIERIESISGSVRDWYFLRDHHRVRVIELFH